ncbi:MAG: UvrB/UvrC motif-containing protein, partial [Gemmatimonadota bacterium]
RLLKRVHGATRHAGKSPAGAGSAPRPAAAQAVAPAAASEELSHLRQELEKAVAAEAYERAAELRDRISQLQAEGAGRA